MSTPGKPSVPKVTTWLGDWLDQHKASRPGKEGWPEPNTPAARRCWSDWVQAMCYGLEPAITRREADKASGLMPDTPVWCEEHPAAIVATVKALRVQAEEQARSKQAAALESAGVVFEESPEGRMERAGEALAEFSRLGWTHVFDETTNRFRVERALADAPRPSVDLSQRMREYAYEIRSLLGRPWPTWEECLRPDGSFDWRVMVAKMDGVPAGEARGIGVRVGGQGA